MSARSFQHLHSMTIADIQRMDWLRKQKWRDLETQKVHVDEESSHRQWIVLFDWKFDEVWTHAMKMCEKRQLAKVEQEVWRPKMVRVYEFLRRFWSLLYYWRLCGYLDFNSFFLKPWFWREIDWGVFIEMWSFLTWKQWKYFKACIRIFN